MGFKRSVARMRAIEQRLRDGMAARGIIGAVQDEIVQSITSFALYGFPECIGGETRVIDADTGRTVAIEDIATGRVPVVTTLACDSDLRLQRRRVVRAIASGRKMVYRLRTSLGRRITATAEHPFLTVTGWRKLGELSAGDHVAAARSLPSLGRTRWRRHELIVLAGLVAEGNLCHPSTFYFYTTDVQHRDEFVGAVQRFDNTRATIRRHRSCHSVHVRRRDPSRPIGAVEWVRRLGLWGLDSHTKHLPDAVFELDAACLGLLLARLWDGDGHLSNTGHASYDTASHRLAEHAARASATRYRVACVRTHASVSRANGDRLHGDDHRQRKPPLVPSPCRPPFPQPAEAPDDRNVGGIGGVRSCFTRRDPRRGERVGGSRAPEPVLDMDAGRSRSRARLANRLLPDVSKRGYRRWVIERLAEYFDSPDLARLSRSDVYWDRVAAIEPVGIRETYDLQIEDDHNFLANDFVVHNSHAASFALIAYASAYLKAHHPAAFCCGLLNAYPMGFYHPATLVKDGQRHGVRFLPVDVMRSAWKCTIEDGAVRIGLRYVMGLRQESGERLVAARPLASVAEVAQRGMLRRNELEVLAHGGALSAFGLTRRDALWQAAAVERDATSLLARVRPPAAMSPLPSMTAYDETAADYTTTSLTVGPHVMSYLRSELTARGVHAAADLEHIRDGAAVRVAGHVIVRQRPGTAKGMCFLTLEDETGTANAFLTPPLYERWRVLLNTSALLEVQGLLEHREGVTHVRALRLRRLQAPDRMPVGHNYA